jgi:KaiC/GvpD/RAD55 family RecA-like ATPase
VDNSEHPHVCVHKKKLRSRQEAALLSLKKEKRNGFATLRRKFFVQRTTKTANSALQQPHADTLCTMERKKTAERLRRKLFLVDWKMGQHPQFTLNAHMP